MTNGTNLHTELVQPHARPQVDSSRIDTLRSYNTAGNPSRSCCTYHLRLPFFRAAFPPANSAFSVRRARCLCFSALRAPLVSYLTFLGAVLDFFVEASVFGLGREADADVDIEVDFDLDVGKCVGEVGDRVRGSEGPGPCNSASGSKSSTTATVARTSSSAYSCSCSICPSRSEPSRAPERPVHSVSSAGERQNTLNWEGGETGRVTYTERRHKPARLEPHFPRPVVLTCVFASEFEMKSEDGMKGMDP